MTSTFDLRIRPRTVQQEVVDKLRDAILSGVFRPGTRLVESQLCRSLGVSRPSLREALRCLQAERLIEIVPNRGPHIPLLSWRDAEEIYELRALLEGEAAASCAAMIREEEIEALSDRLEAFGQATNRCDLSEQIRTAAEFYSIIFRNCGNKIIEEVLTGLLARVSFLRARSMSSVGRAQCSYREMKDLYCAIKSRMPRRARKAAKAHVGKAREAARKSFV